MEVTLATSVTFCRRCACALGEKGELLSAFASLARQGKGTDVHRLTRKASLRPRPCKLQEKGQRSVKCEQGGSSPRRLLNRSLLDELGHGQSVTSPRRLITIRYHL